MSFTDSGKNKYTEAYALIDDAVSKFGTDDLLTSKRHEVSVTEIKNKIKDYEDSKPVRLSDLKVTNNNYCHFLYETEHDPRGNSYTDALYMPYYSKNWISTIGYVEFYTGKKYSKFVCYIVPQEDFNTKRLGDGEGARIKIYADEKLVYTSEIITYKTERIDVEIDIKAANYLMIVIDGDYESTIYTPTLNTLLCEPVVYK